MSEIMGWTRKDEIRVPVAHAGPLKEMVKFGFACFKNPNLAKSLGCLAKKTDAFILSKRHPYGGGENVLTLTAKMTYQGDFDGHSVFRLEEKNA